MSNHQTLYMFDRKLVNLFAMVITKYFKGTPIIFRFTRPSLILYQEDKSWCFIDSEGLHVLLMGHHLSQTKLLNNLIMFEGSTLADNLCALNNWDRRTLRLHALELGLR